MKLLRIISSLLVLYSIPAAAQTAHEDILYSANFRWSTADQAPQAMQLVILRNRKPRYTETSVIARIMNGNRREAVCQVGNLEVGAEISSLELTCRSAAFGTLSAAATVFFHASASQNYEDGPSMLRFGTWMSGYEQAALQVRTNHSARLIELLTQKPVKLASE